MRRTCITGALLLLCSCDGGGLPEGHFPTPEGSGPRVVWDLEAEPLPEIPLPNDVATWPDPSSPTGRRVNASLIAPSGMERRLRAEFDRLDGWGTFSPITVRFEAPLDIANLVQRQGRGRFRDTDFPRHAIYLVDLETGVPVPLDVGSGRFPQAVAGPSSYYSNDPRAGTSNLMFDTVEEDTNGNGRLDPGEDTDFDGVLDHPNTLDGRLSDAPNADIDELLTFYERETDTLILRPVVPLSPTHEYAVVLTDRLRGEDGASVRSPFESVHHIAQTDELASLPDIFGAAGHLYGDLAVRGWEGVAFAWKFTTQSTRGDLVALREGLYGRGPFARLAEEFPARLTPVPLRGGLPTAPCDTGPRVFRITPAELRVALDDLPIDDLGFPIAQLDAVLASLEVSVSHLAYAFFESPYLLGDPEAENVNDTWDIDRQTGEARIDRDLVPMFIVVPKETETHRQPFPTTLYAHGLGSLNIEAIAFAGQVANHGVATVAIDAQSHGIPLASSLAVLLQSVLGQSCLAPMGVALSIDRAHDLNGDGSSDSAGLFFSAYMFHTRDALRQSSLDWLQAVRILRTFDGHPDFPDGYDWAPGEVVPERGDPLVFAGDIDGDGQTDRAGDFDGDGVPDIGGYDVGYRQWGSSLGGILSMLNIGVEPSIVAAAPVSGGGGLFDVGLRTSLGSARHPVWLRVLGPIVASRPVSGPDSDTACDAGARSVYFELPDLSDKVETEIGCVAEANLSPGDAVVLANLVNGELSCAGVGADGRFRLAVPTDEGDRLSLLIYGQGADRIDYEHCTFEGDEPPLLDIVDTWRSGSGRGAGNCARCSRYQTRDFEADSPLIAPIEGLGLSRQSPDLRRLAGLGQLALEPADPVNYARHVFLDPATAIDVTPGRTRSVMVMSTAGDDTVPPSASYAYARAAGVLAFLPPEAPDEYADWRAPSRVRDVFGVATPDDVVIDTFALEGLARTGRHPVEGTDRFVFDVDDISDGRLFFMPGRSTQLAPADGGVAPARPPIPLRWGRESRPALLAPGLDPWRTDGDFPGVSVVLNAMTNPTGQHVILPVDPEKLFDEGQQLLNLIGWYLASGGTELAWQEVDPSCLEDSSCFY